MGVEAFDSLAVQFEGTLVPVVLPPIQRLVASADWNERFCALMALSEISTG